MSEHFSQAVLYLKMMQVAESIERVKGVRQGPFLQNIDPADQNEHVPYVLRRAYGRIIQAF